jgi:hypothetical protein
MPRLLTRIVPSVGLEVLFTTALDPLALPPLLLVCVEGAAPAAELVVLLLELLPQAASRSEVATAGRESFSR